MKVYSFKCESCGSKQYVKTKNGYKCKYCGSLQDVIAVSEERKIDDNEQKNASSTINTRSDPGYWAHMKGEAKKTLVLFFVCMFAGVYGVHKFMEHKIFTGIIYFLTFGLLGFGWFVDVVKLAIKLAIELKESGGAQ